MNPTPNLLGQALEPSYGPNRVGDAMLYLGETRDLVRLSIETIAVDPGVSLTVRLLLGEVPSQIVVKPVSSVLGTGPFEWDNAWDAEIYFRDRKVQSNTNVYLYSEEN